MKTIFGLLALIATLSAAQSASYSYTAQNQWPGICVTGNAGRQSPIDIKTNNTNIDYNLTALEFDAQYGSKIKGNFKNTGNNVEFYGIQSRSLSEC